LPNLLKKLKVNLLYTTDSSTFCNFKPSLVFNQDILAFDKSTLKKMPFNLSKIRLLLIRFIQIKAMNRANHVIFLSEFSKKLISNFLREDINYSIVPHGREYVKKEYIKTSWDFNKNINLLYVSPILKYKNHEVVIKSYEKLKNKYKNLKIKFVGNIHDKSLCHNLILKYKTINKENFIGGINQSEIKEYIKEADIFIFASSSETFGISLLEAMTQSVPIVCSNQSSLPEVLQDGGLYFDPYNYIDLYTKIDLLISDVNLREKLSKKALNISKQYSWIKNLKSFYNIINKIV
jgi:glycosyltransferase involved in cell wall biosynthesis